MLLDYTSLAMRTAVPLSDNCSDFVHGTLGLVTESLELRQSDSYKNTLEELGDLCWFTALCSTAINQPVFTADDWPLRASAFDQATAMEVIQEKATHLCDIAKKWLAYGKKPDANEAVFYLRSILGLVEAIGHQHDLTLTCIQEANIRKLQARFPNKYSNTLALNRDKRAEYAAMGGDQ